MSVDPHTKTSPSPTSGSFLDPLIRFSLEKKLVIVLLAAAFAVWGLLVAPFDWDFGSIPRDSVPVDAIPDIGENQQIVFTEWPGRSPQDVEDQITYPLTVALLGIPEVKTIRSFSMFGFSTVYIIFSEQAEFYWSRSRIVEKLNSLPTGTLPEDAKPALGPDATALGQVFWYTLEGLDAEGHPTGGWDLEELRSIQDWLVRYALLSSEGVSEVASIGGFVREYQIDVDPDAMRAYNVTLDEVVQAVQKSNVDVGARTIEVNRVEYVIRGLGFIRKLEDLENTVVKTHDNVPFYLKNIARLGMGPALRRGVLDKEGTEAVGGVVVVRFGENPLQTIQNIRKKIEEISPGLPRKTLPDGTSSQVQIVPFYDRTGLIYETLGTLNTAIFQQILITVVVVVLMVMHLRSSLLISGLLPLAVLMTFIAMKLFKVDANIVALSGIAIAIGAMVDMGIVICENILKRLEEAPSGADRREVIFHASSEVGGAVLTAVSTTILGFLPVFAMEAAEGKLFRPLAFTKTFALFASVIVAIVIIPPLAHLLFAVRSPFGGRRLKSMKIGFYVALSMAGAIVGVFHVWWIGIIVGTVALAALAEPILPDSIAKRRHWLLNMAVVVIGILFLSGNWNPLGPEKGLVRNSLIVGGAIGGVILAFYLFQKVYGQTLMIFLNHKIIFLFIPGIIVFFGMLIWQGFDRILGWLPASIRTRPSVSAFAHRFPGLGKEFMPPLDEGSYLYMPTTMPHASISEVQDILQKQDRAIRAIPEVKSVVGKLGRVESPLDPAPVSMIETVIDYRPEFLSDKSGHMLTFRHEAGDRDLFRDRDGQPLPAPDGEPYWVQGRFIRDASGALIPEKAGMPFRLWRSPLDSALNEGRAAWAGVRTPDDIWDEIVKAAQMPGVTSAPRLQPIAARVVMLQSGMRAPMGIKVRGPDLETIERISIQLEELLKEVPSIEPASVFADRIVGKPYIEIAIDRPAIARYGISIRQVQDVIETAIGGRPITTTVEGRERYPVRVRYPRELRDSIESLQRILVPASDSVQIPLSQLADLRYVRGPQMIKSEDTFLTGYVLFDKRPDYAEVNVVEQARDYLELKIAQGALEIPVGVSYRFSGSYENQIRAAARLRLVIPLALLTIFIVLYLQFNSISTTSLVFSAILVAWAGGFIMLWLYSQSWFLDFPVFGVSLRELFQVRPIHLSVAVWVGFLALFGIASDDGVVMATYLKQSFDKRRPESPGEIRDAAVEAGKRRVRPCLMTTATTVLALLPVLTSSGRGSEVMVPMAIPTFGGMLIVMISMFIVPVLYAAVEETRWHWQKLK